MTNSPVTLVATAPSLTATSVRYGNMPMTVTGPLRYYPTPTSRWNLAKETWHNGVLSKWFTGGTGTAAYNGSLPASGGTGAQVTITTAASGKFYTDNSSIANLWRFRNRGESHNFSIEVYQTAGVRTVQINVQELGGGGGVSGTSGNLSVPSGVWTRVSFAYTPLRKPAFLMQLNISTAQGWVNSDVVYFRNPLIEPGVGATPGTYFDGTTIQSTQVPAPMWWDQRTYFSTGIDAGISISDAAWLIEYMNQNFVTNPYTEINTTGHTYTNCSGARTQDYAIQGAWSTRLTATTTNATDAVSVTTIGPGNFALHAIVINEQSAARTCQWLVDGTPVGSSVSVAAYAETEIRATYVEASAGAARTFAIRWANSANTETFITEYMYVGGAWTDATNDGPFTLCPTIDDTGTINPLWAWLGSAHASRSSQAAAVAFSVPTKPHLFSTRSSVVLRGMRKATWKQFDATSRAWMTIAGPNQSISDFHALAAGDLSVQARVASAPVSITSSYSTVTATQGLAADTMYDINYQWDEAQYELHNIGVWDRIGTRNSNPPSKLLDNVVAFDQGGALILKQFLFATRMLNQTERDYIHSQTFWGLDVINALQSDPVTITPQANYNGPVPDTSVGAGLTDLLISAPGGHSWRTFNAWDVAAGWQINDHGTFAAILEMEDVSAYCGTTEALQGRDLRWQHTNLGWWRGVITDASPRPADGVVEITAKGYSWWLSKRVTPKIARFVSGPPGALINALLTASKREATLPYDSIQIDEVGAPMSYETRMGNVFDVVRSITSRSAQEWRNDMDANQFEWRQEIGRNLVSSIQLVDGIHIVGDYRPAFSLEGKTNALLVQPDDARYRARASFFQEDGDSIDAYGRLEDSQTYVGAAARSSLRPIAKADVRQRSRTGRTFQCAVADIADCFSWFRNGDQIRLMLPKINQCVNLRVMVRTWDSSTGLLTISGYAN